MDQILAAFRPDLFAGKQVLDIRRDQRHRPCRREGLCATWREVIATGASQARLDAARADAEAKAIRFELLDVRDRKAIDAFVGALPGLDALINAAGVAEAGGGI